MTSDRDQAEPRHMKLTGFPERGDAELLERARSFRELMARRRTVRAFSDRPVPREVIDEAIRTAGSAPSGANKQPWFFSVVASPEHKARIREAAEEEERAFYGGRASAEWLRDLRPFGTDWQKPFLEVAPALIVVFQRSVGTPGPDGTPSKHYYVKESTGLAAGLLIASLHQAGLATLTHTPSPMRFLQELCGRPDTDRAMMIVVTGFPAADATVPDITRKPLDDIRAWL